VAGAGPGGSARGDGDSSGAPDVRGEALRARTVHRLLRLARRGAQAPFDSAPSSGDPIRDGAGLCRHPAGVAVRTTAVRSTVRAESVPVLSDPSPPFGEPTTHCGPRSPRDDPRDPRRPARSVPGNEQFVLGRFDGPHRQDDLADRQGLLLRDTVERARGEDRAGSAARRTVVGPDRQPQTAVVAVHGTALRPDWRTPGPAHKRGQCGSRGRDGTGGSSIGSDRARSVANSDGSLQGAWKRSIASLRTDIRVHLPSRRCGFPLRNSNPDTAPQSVAGATVSVTVVSPLIWRLDSPAHRRWFVSLATAVKV
jgi:hypothetical protein